MKIDEKTFNAMPDNLRALFTKLPNPESDEVLAGFPQTTSVRTMRGDGIGKGYHGSDSPHNTERGFDDTGSAARFFYCAKASKSDRDEGCEGLEEQLKLTQMRSANGTGEKNFEGGFPDVLRRNHHPTVKPTALMRYLVKLVTRRGGVVLDPFMGSGSTGKACAIEGMEFIGIDLSPEYCEIAARRIEAAKLQEMTLPGVSA